MVEQLLQLLVGVVDAQLLEAVDLENLEAGDIEYADETGTLPLGAVQWSIDSRHDPLEQTLIGCLGDGLNGELNLLLGLRLGDVVPTNLDTWLEEGLRQVSDLDTQEVGNLQNTRVKWAS